MAWAIAEAAAAGAADGAYADDHGGAHGMGPTSAPPEPLSLADRLPLRVDFLSYYGSGARLRAATRGAAAWCRNLGVKGDIPSP